MQGALSVCSPLTSSQQVSLGVRVGELEMRKSRLRRRSTSFRRIALYFKMLPRLLSSHTKIPEVLARINPRRHLSSRGWFIRRRHLFIRTCKYHLVCSPISLRDGLQIGLPHFPLLERRDSSTQGVRRFLLTHPANFLACKRRGKSHISGSGLLFRYSLPVFCSAVGCEYGRSPACSIQPTNRSIHLSMS